MELGATVGSVQAADGPARTLPELGLGHHRADLRQAGGVEVERRVLRDPAGGGALEQATLAVDADAEGGTGVGDVEEVAVDGTDHAGGRAHLADGLAAYGVGRAEVVQRDVGGVEVDGEQVGADRSAVVGLVPLADRQARRDLVGDVARDHRRRDAGATRELASDPAAHAVGRLTRLAHHGARLAQRASLERPEARAVVVRDPGACRGRQATRWPARPPRRGSS